MFLGTKARYAVMAMVELAARDASKPVALSELSESQEIPLPYLEQIFSRLRKAELVCSARGPGGGYRLNRAPGAINIAEIVQAVDEPIKMTRCEAHGTGGCMAKNARCATHDLWEGLGEHIHGYLSGVKLGDVAGRQTDMQRMEAMT